MIKIFLASATLMTLFATPAFAQNPGLEVACGTPAKSANPNCHETEGPQEETEPQDPQDIPGQDGADGVANAEATGIGGNSNAEANSEAFGGQGGSATSLGGTNSLNINNTSLPEIRLAPARSTQGDVSCEVPVFEVSYVPSHSGYVALSLRTPLPSRSQINCERRSTLVLEQAQLDNTLDLMQTCLTLEAIGATLTETAPEELIAACAMVN